jgi:hypothetical protein
MAKIAPSSRKQTNLETANEMFKAAFLIKKERFAKLNPDLSEKELYQKTVAYFHKLSENKSW